MRVAKEHFPMRVDTSRPRVSRETPPKQRMDSSSAADLTEVYHRYFDVVPATTSELLDEALRLRYQVYCVEHAFENPREHPDGREIDRYDSHSVHSLLIHKPTRAVVGTVRLILPGDEPLPITEICHDPRLQDPAVFPPATTAEISRFAISKTFRRRAEDARGLDASLVDAETIADPTNRRVIPHMALGLIKAVGQMSVSHGITHLCAVMDPALLRLLQRLGIRFDSLGPPISYHGMRQPCHATPLAISWGLRAERPDAWDLITEQGALSRQISKR